ncbi:MAG: hypothetical protein DRQ56_02565 [Gammaproteobacteria bacterium]|nr:MAG: hypothetical protein DRQ56_02565 [Gammaproteobacteria bacterium]
MFEVNLPASDEEPAVESESNWSIHLPSINMNESQLHWRSQYTSPAVVEVSRINLELTDLSWPPVGETNLGLSLTINNIASLSINGGIFLQNGAGKLQYKLADLQAAWFNPNIPEAFRAKITRGAVGVEGQLALVDFSPDRLQMDGAVTDFSGIIEGTEDALTSWDSISWRNLDLSLSQHSVQVKVLKLDRYAGRLHIYEDGTVNMQSVLQEEVELAREGGDLPEESAAEWTFDFPSIYIIDSQLDFKDESLPINFRTVIGDLNGDITGLSSRPESETTIDLKGSVDGYAPVVLKGAVRPFAETAFVDIALSFDGVDLVRLTPYSGTYAGHAIDRGILNLKLHYLLDGNQLKGDNSAVIEQLKLGQKIDSEKAVELPLQLAIALLTDMNGVIDMDVPVSGDLEDPEFGLGSAIAAAFVNLISKAVTAPFALLANLAGSEEDLQRVNFQSGASAIDERARTQLADLVAALQQRPAVNLVLFGRLHPRADKERLQRDHLDVELQAAGLSTEDIANKSPLWADVIRARYRQLPGATDTNADGSEVTIHTQYQQVVANIDINDEQLKKLAQVRAVAVKRYLVNELQLPANRSVIELVDVHAEENIFSGVELGVDI